MRLRGFGLLGLLALGHLAQGQVPTAGLTIDGHRFEARRVREYHFDPTVTAAALACPYAQAYFLNPSDWTAHRRYRRLVGVELVYTAHPADTSAWLTPFGQLLTARWRSLQLLEPRLTDPAVLRQLQLSIVAQTDVPTRARAEALFHGAIIRYETYPWVADQPGNPARLELELERLRQIVSGRVPPPDTTLIPILQRNPSWLRCPTVVDWTGSMYPVGASLIAALHRLGRDSLIGELLFFNDGDDFDVGVALRRKPIGRAGGLHLCPAPDQLAEVLATMTEVMLRGDGGEPAENNLEALLWMQRRVRGRPGARILHVADNRSEVRDLELLQQLTTPVDIIACEQPPEPGAPVRKPTRVRPNLDLLTIAWATAGSFHLGATSLQFGQVRAPGPWTIDGVRYGVAADAIVRLK